MTRICQVPDCSRKHRQNGYCDKHAQQVRLHGHILERTIYTPNVFVVEGDVCRIQIYDIKGNHSYNATIDADNYNIVKDRKWRVCCGRVGFMGYVASGWKETFILLHRLLTGAPDGQMVDHKDRDTLNNKRENLRFCTRSQNKMNSRTPRHSKSGVKNVCFATGPKKWQSHIKVDGKKIHLGFFDRLEDAKQAVDDNRLKYHGEFLCDGTPRVIA